MFAQLDADAVALNDDELKQLFGRSQAKKARTEKSVAAHATGVISLLPMRRANNIGIVLTQFRATPQTVVEAVANLNDSFFGQQGVRLM